MRKRKMVLGASVCNFSAFWDGSKVPGSLDIVMEIIMEIFPLSF
jgi:hypothetical protein